VNPIADNSSPASRAMFEKAKAAAKAGADSAERAAKQTKLKADILLIENKLKTLKMEFGKDVYPAMAAGDRQTTETLFMTTKGKVEAMDRAGLKPGFAAGNSVNDIPMLKKSSELALCINPSDELYETALAQKWMCVTMGEHR